MKFAALAVFCVGLVSSSDDVGSDKSNEPQLRKRHLVSESNCNVTLTWEPGITLHVSDTSDGSCYDVGTCTIQDTTCHSEGALNTVTLARPDGFDEGVINQVSSSAWTNPVNLFRLADGTTNRNCLTITDQGSGNWHGIKLSSADGLEATVYEDGQVACSGGTTLDNPVDYSWSPRMTLQVVGEYLEQLCEGAGGCTFVPNEYFSDVEIRRPDGFDEHVVRGFYFSEIEYFSTSFRTHAELDSVSHDCLVDPILGSQPQLYGGIRLTGNSNMSAVIEPEGYVICRSLEEGDDCKRDQQCLSDNCTSGKCRKRNYGWICHENEDCNSGICNSDSLEQFGHNRCDIEDPGEEDAFCSNDEQCDTGLECTFEDDWGSNTCQTPRNVN